MTRKECERQLLDLAAQMYAVYKEYNPTADFLSMIADKDGYICVDDCYFNSERKIIMDANNFPFRTVNCTHYSNGDENIGGKFIIAGVAS